MIVLDTDLISELLKLLPAPQVAGWLQRQEASQIYLTAISLAELRYGVDRLPPGHRRETLGIQIDRLFGRNADGRVLSFDEHAAYEFGEIAARVDGQMSNMVFDIQIAAIARARGASVATRNIKHFQLFEVPLINPWDD